MKTGLPRLPDLDGGDVDLDRSKRQCARIRVHLIYERPQRDRAADGNEGVGREDDEIPAGRFFGVNCHGCLRIEEVPHCAFAVRGRTGLEVPPSRTRAVCDRPTE